MVTLHIGIDDTDSPRMGCTTYVAALLVERLKSLGASFLDYPKLVRLNPNVPWKTRGNGAVSLSINCRGAIVEEIKEMVVETVEENSDLSYPRTDPGIAFLEGPVPRELTLFAKKAITSVVEKKVALNLAREIGVELKHFGDELGVIGGMAAIGETLTGDHTYELLAYRAHEYRGSVRRVDVDSVMKMDRLTHSGTFNNVDLERRRILITPRGPDPILWGIRGESPEIVKRANELLRAYEPIERWVIFVTNQGTDAHLKRVCSVSEVREFNPVIVKGEVSSRPRVVPRRHIIFTLKDDTGEIDCAAYEPTGILRRTAAKLEVGDVVEVMGGVRPATARRPLTINLEKMRVIGLKTKIRYHNPLCPDCVSRMKSMGREKGFRCPKCGLRARDLSKQRMEVLREIESDLYISPPRSQRHLTKPLIRYGREKDNREIKLMEGWHEP